MPDRPAGPDAAITALPPLRQVIAEYGLAARKGLGQHFLLDLNLTARIARAAAPLAGATVLEIGPGPGGLTRALLLEGAGRVIAVEKDARAVRALAPLVAAVGGRLELIEADALAVDERALAGGAEGARGLKIVANLPYNIATPLIVKWLRQVATEPAFYAAIVLTLQKEVAERLCAAVGTKAYGRLTIVTRWLCRPELCFDIAPRAFTPPPKVTSSVVRLIPREAPQAPARWVDMEDVTRAAFGQRRKMLRTSLKTVAPGGDAAALLAAAGIAETARAETIEVEGFAALARALAKARGSAKRAAPRPTDPRAGP